MDITEGLTESFNARAGAHEGARLRNASSDGGRHKSSGGGEWVSGGGERDGRNSTAATKPATLTPSASVRRNAFEGSGLAPKPPMAAPSSSGRRNVFGSGAGGSGRTAEPELLSGNGSGRISFQSSGEVVLPSGKAVASLEDLQPEEEPYVPVLPGNPAAVYMGRASPAGGSNDGGDLRPSPRQMLSSLPEGAFGAKAEDSDASLTRVGPRRLVPIPTSRWSSSRKSDVLPSID